jgi:ribosomal protein S18 acetylase RimI-like enzyme
MGEVDLKQVRATKNSIRDLEGLDRAIFPVRYSESFYKKLLKDVDKHPYIFLHKGQKIGVCTFHVNTELNSSYIMTLGVLPEYRRKGIGSEMLRRVEANIESYGVDRICLHVQSNNCGGMSFYKKSGYKIIGIEMEYYKKITPRSAYLLEKPL